MLWLWRRAADPHTLLCLAVLAAECLQAFKSLLTIVQAGGSHVDVDGSLGADFKLAPLTVAEIAADIVIRSHSLSSPSPLALNLSQHQGLFQ